MLKRYVFYFIFAFNYFAFGDTFEDAIRKDLGADFKIINLRRIFYVGANITEDEFQRCLGTISRMDDHLTKHFIKKRPSFLLKVYLFKDSSSYSDFCRSHFGDEPTTPFGFYHSRTRMLVMNIATGRGTLAHELVHPFIESDFPGAPAWFDEGFASLYEQSIETDGKMKGLVNWRLPGLQKAIRSEKLTSLSKFMADSSDNFYKDDSGENYARARYLCMYLQEHSKLEEFYKLYRDKFSTDFTGRKILEQVSGKKLSEIEKSFHTWALGLK